MIVGELVVVEAEEPQQRDMKIADMSFAIHCIHTEFVCRADGVAGVAAATGEPDRHGIRVVIATVSGAAADTVIGCATEFTAPDDQRAVEQTALLEVGDQGGNGLVHAAYEIAMRTLDVIVAVQDPW